LLGAWNVKCPNFVANPEITFEEGGRRYEPGVLNAQGMLGMKASADLLTEVGIESVASRLLDLKRALLEGMATLKYSPIGPRGGSGASGISSFTDLENPDRVSSAFRTLHENGVVLSFRHDRDGVPYLRFSPHFYNTFEEVERIMKILRDSRT
ncbi:MAG: aminotransferase class V-fold PLP-dependent enzyme, partial [Verrucomicrobiota bacterium]